jgi:hypothetical protein
MVEEGQEVAVSTPVNAALTEMVHEIEAGRRPIAPENLAELSRQAGLGRV